MNGPSADQVTVFLAVVEHGTFAGAAKALRRAQSAVTYAVKRLEDSVGEPLFDRTEYRPVLTAAGRALVPNARRIADSIASFQARAASLSQGLEAEVSIVVDAVFPMHKVSHGLRALSEAFPTVTTQLHVESYARASSLLTDGTCVLGLLNEQSCAQAATPLAIHPICVVELAPVVSPRHPLATISSPVPVEELSGHIRLVLGNRPPPGAPAANAAFYGALWYVSDVAAKRDLLLSAVGWGIMPIHMIEEDLAAGRLVRIQPQWTDYPAQTGGQGQHFVSMCSAHRAGHALGPATSWLLDLFIRQT